MHEQEPTVEAEAGILVIDGHELHEGVDWVRAAGVSFEILFATYPNDRGEVVLRLEDTATGNTSERVISASKELETFASLPEVIRARTLELLAAQPSPEASSLSVCAFHAHGH
mgnify:FL=1